MYASPNRDELLETELRRSLREKTSLKKSNDYKVTTIKELRKRHKNLEQENTTLKEELEQIKTHYKGKYTVY